MQDTAESWSGRQEAQEFPLTLLHATFPKRRPGKPRRIELAYRFTAPEGQWLWFWRASRPTYVSTITVDASELALHYDCNFEDFLPSVDRGVASPEGVEGVYVVGVRNWVVKGHGVALACSPLRPASSHERSPP